MCPLRHFGSGPESERSGNGQRGRETLMTLAVYTAKTRS
jgi:hypothetical protein